MLQTTRAVPLHLEVTHRIGNAVPQSAIERSAARKVSEILDLGDIKIGGERPWDIQVYDPRFYRYVMAHGSMGAGESYMDGWWDVEALDEFFARVQRINPYDKIGRLETVLLSLKCRLTNRQTEHRAVRVARLHYDLGTDLYRAMLDGRMQYTCAYWRDALSLDEAQLNKLHLICRKMYLRPGMTVLELGGGFGGLAHFLASEYGCHVVSYNISQDQVAYARNLCSGLPVRIELKDYREAANEREHFDRVVAIGLCEHIGYKNYGRFLSLVRDRLADRGLFLLHTIGSNISVTTTDPWIERYIFPNSMIPSIAQLGAAAEHGWVIEDLHAFGPDYDRTLLAWWDNFQRAWPDLEPKYGERFYRMWRYYLMASAGTFRSRKLQLWQLVLSKGDIPFYEPVR